MCRCSPLGENPVMEGSSWEPLRCSVLSLVRGCPWSPTSSSCLEVLLTAPPGREQFLSFSDLWQGWCSMLRRLWRWQGGCRLQWSASLHSGWEPWLWDLCHIPCAPATSSKPCLSPPSCQVCFWPVYRADAWLLAFNATLGSLDLDCDRPWPPSVSVMCLYISFLQLNGKLHKAFCFLSVLIT